MGTKKKDNKANAKKLWLSISIPSVVALATIIPPTTIAIINATKPNINEYVFTNNDIISLRNNLNDEINKNNLTIELFESNMLNYFKSYLKATNTNISNLILNVQIEEHLENLIKFKVTLDSNNNQYLYDGNNQDITISSNILDITFQGVNSLEFKSSN